MLKPICFAAILLLASPSNAQFIDYELLFADKADQTTHRTLANGTTVTDLRLDHGVVVTRQPDGSFISFTKTGNAPGCMFEILLSLRAVSQTCAATFGPERRENLDSMVETFSHYMARNAYPPLEISDVTAMINTRTGALMSEHKNAVICDPAQNPDMDGWLKMTDTLAQPEGRAAIDDLPDMLPVANPCS